MKILKRTLLSVAALVLLVAGAAVVVYFVTSGRMSRTYEISPRSILIPTDSATLTEGARLARIHCTHCHGAQLEGKRMFQDESIGYVDAPNLTRGQGGVGTAYADIDWIRSIKHGVRPSGTPLVVMPSKEFHYLSDRDLGAIIAHIKNLRPVDNVTHGYQLSFFSHILAAFGAFGDFLAVESIQHDVHPPAPEPGVTVAYGEYLVNTGGCRACHGEDLAGGRDPNPQAPPSPNLTPGGPLKTWSETEFMLTLRTGFTPDKRPLQDVFMPWTSFSNFNDDELRAIWMYLRAQPALATKD